MPVPQVIKKASAKNREILTIGCPPIRENNIDRMFDASFLRVFLYVDRCLGFWASKIPAIRSKPRTNWWYADVSRKKTVARTEAA